MHLQVSTKYVGRVPQRWFSFYVYLRGRNFDVFWWRRPQHRVIAMRTFAEWDSAGPVAPVHASTRGCQVYWWSYSCVIFIFKYIWRPEFWCFGCFLMATATMQGYYGTDVSRIRFNMSICPCLCIHKGVARYIGWVPLDWFHFRYLYYISLHFMDTFLLSFHPFPVPTSIQLSILQILELSSHQHQMTSILTTFEETGL